MDLKKRTVVFKLRLKLKEKKYPYPNKKLDKEVIWGGIYLGVYNKSGRVCDLIDVDWDIREIISWLLENKNDILFEKPILDTVDKSIAEVLQNYQKMKQGFDEDLNCKIYEYNLKHNLKNALRNNNAHDIYLGVNSEGAHEVSFCTDFEDGKYGVDLKEFYSNFEKHYNAYFQRFL